MSDTKNHVNLALYKRHARPPQDMLKTIRGGRLSGMTDIKPQWRIEVLTEMFGPCGKGWGYVIDEPNIIDCSEGQKVVSVKVRLWYMMEGERHEIEAYGGSTLIAKEKNGLFTNDEAFKMAVTDGMSTAAKHLGIAGDIYMGMWDGSKYRDESHGPQPAQRSVPQNGNGHTNGAAPTPKQRLVALIREYSKCEPENLMDASSRIFKAAGVKVNGQASEPQIKRAIAFIEKMQKDGTEYSQI